MIDSTNELPGRALIRPEPTTAVNEIQQLEQQVHTPSADHEHGPRLISLPSTRYIDSFLSMLTKHSGALGLLIALVLALAFLVTAFKK